MLNTLKLTGAIRIGSLSADPGTAENGALYYNTTAGKFRKYEGGSWTDLVSEVAEFADDTFRIQDDADPTKQIAFQASGISASTTRTITMPDANVDLGLIATAIQSSEKGAANGVATLDAGGKIPTAQLPPLAITDVFTVADNTARDALTVEEGDVAYVTGTGLWWIYDGSAWLELTATGEVSSVNGQTGAVSLDTDDIDEGATNLYFTDARAKAAAVADAIADGVTDVAPSQNAVFDALATKIGSLVEDTTPQLGGALDLNGQNVEGTLKRAALGGGSSFVEEQYLHAETLTASQSDQALANLQFAHATYEGLEIAYKIKEATTNRVRIGTLRVVTNGTDVSIVDTFGETADVGVSWSAAVVGANVEVRYTTTANNKTMRADVKRFKA